MDGQLTGETKESPEKSAGLEQRIHGHARRELSQQFVEVVEGRAEQMENMNKAATVGRGSWK